MAHLSGSGSQLRLANGQAWSLIAVEPLSSWLKQLTTILGLKTGESNDSPKLIFDTSPPLSGSSASASLRAQNMGSEWTYRSLGFMGIWTHSFTEDIIFDLSPESSPGVDVLRMRATVDVIYSQAIYAGGLPLHGGLVVRDGVGVVLAGPSGVGKSTCCRRIPLPWYSPCDDEVLLVKDSLGEIRGHPCPSLGDYQRHHSSQTRQIQTSFPLKGIFFLNKSQRDGIYSTGPGEGAILVNDSARDVLSQFTSYMSPSDAALFRSRVLELACGLAKEIPIFKLSVSPIGKFWTKIERAIHLSE